MRTIDGGLDSTWPAKARHLAEARNAGLPVPNGWVWRSEDPPSQRQLASAVAGVGSAQLIARSALVGEDEAEHSAAGLGLSLGALHGLKSVTTALERIEAARTDPQLAIYREGLDTDADAVILQHFIRPAAVVVGAVLSSLDYIEVHTEDAALAKGSTPVFTGQPIRWGHPSAAAVQSLMGRVRDAFGQAPFGLDVEIVIDADDRAHLVQVRPLTADILADGLEFVDEARRAGQTLNLRGDLVLDAEHNPEVLSVAHGSLIDWIGANVPGAGKPRTVLGWLYTQRLVRDLKGHAVAALSPTAALACLEDELLPEARLRLTKVTSAVESADAAALALQLDEAQSSVSQMLDGYLRVLVPARAAAGLSDAAKPEAPLSTRGRHAFVDVLPARWDIASPTLAALHQFTAPSRTPLASEQLSDGEAAVLLTEWDDHLFALGLAPLRRVYLRAAALFALTDAEVFALSMDELRSSLLRGSIDTRLRTELGARLTERTAWNRLRPPLRIDSGVALPWLPRARLRGLGVGPPFTGPIVQRSGLEALLRDPPGPGSITVLPSLTAQAALALRELGLEAVVCEYGGALSHAALMVRELGMSALIGCRGCTELATGLAAEIDTRTGRLRLRSRLR